MARINGISFNIAGNGPNLSSKRGCLDNSELYISSKLNMLYKQALSCGNLQKSRRALKKLVEGNNLDEWV